MKPPLGGISSFGGGHRHAWCWQILLQKSKIEELQISRKSTLRCFRCCAVLVGSTRRPVVDRVRNDVLHHVAACRTHEPEKFQWSVKTDFFNTIEGRVDLVLTEPKGRLWREAAARRNVRSCGVKPTSRSHSRTSGFDPQRTLTAPQLRMRVLGLVTKGRLRQCQRRR